MAEETLTIPQLLRVRVQLTDVHSWEGLATHAADTSGFIEATLRHHHLVGTLPKDGVLRVNAPGHVSEPVAKAVVDLLKCDSESFRRLSLRDMRAASDLFALKQMTIDDLPSQVCTRCGLDFLPIDNEIGERPCKRRRGEWIFGDYRCMVCLQPLSAGRCTSHCMGAGFHTTEPIPRAASG